MTTQYTQNFQLALPDFRMGPWHDLLNNDLRKIDSLLFNALSGANVSVWQHSTDYHIGDNALDDTDATIWLCVVANTSPATGTFAAYRTAHPTHWTRLLTGFAPRGEWQQNTNYFPYDLVYDTALGIMALCVTRHTSTATGSILDDKVNWAFLLDMSDVGTVTAMSVTYSSTVSHIPKTNVQDAIDYNDSQIDLLKQDSINQGNAIQTEHDKNAAQDTRLTTLEGKTTFTGSITASSFISSGGANAQFGGSAAGGVYTDNNYILIRGMPNNLGIFFQPYGGATNWGYFNPSGLIVNGVGSFTGVISGASLSMAGGGLFQGDVTVKRSAGATTGLIFFGSSGGIYQYFDGGNWNFVGGGAVYATNGRLWGANDTLPIPSGLVTGMRLVYVGDSPASQSAAAEPFGNGTMATGSWWNGSTQSLRYRQLQMLVNGAWAVVNHV